MKLRYQLILLFIVCFLMYSSPIFLGGQIPETPDEAVYVNGAKNWNNLFSEPATLNEEFKTSQFTLPFQFHIKERGVLLGKYPPGMYIWLALLAPIVFFNYYYVVPLTGALTVLVFFFLIKEWFNEKTAWTSTLIFASIPIIWFNSASALVDIPNLMFFLLGLLFIFKGMKKEKITYWILAGVALGFSIWLRYTSVILLVPIGIYLLIEKKKITKGMIILGLVLVLMMIPLMMYHQYYYGNPFKTGYSLENRDFAEPAINKNALTSLFLHVVRFPQEAALGIPFVLTSLLFLLIQWKKKNPLNWLILLTLLISLSFFGLIEWVDGAAHNYLTMTSSYHRYLMPAYALLIIPLCVFVSNLDKRFYKPVVFLILAVNILGALYYPNFSIGDKIHMAKEIKSDTEEILEITDNNSIVMSWIYQRTLFEERKGYHITADNVLMLNDVKKFLDRGYDVYVVETKRDMENGFLDKLEIENITSQSNLTIRKIRGINYAVSGN